MPNNSFERDRHTAAPFGSLHSFAAPAAPQLKRWAGKKTEFPRILLEKFRFDQLQDLTSRIA